MIGSSSLLSSSAIIHTALGVGLSALLGVASANAGCGFRPGTPNKVRIAGASATAMTVEWRNTTGKFASGPLKWWSEPVMYFDMYFRNGNKQQIGRDLTGQGSFLVQYGELTRYRFDKLAPNTRYCFALRARTEGGTQGCVSAVTSNWGCGATKRL